MPQNIIVRMPNWLGDAVMGVPVLHDLRRAFPKSHIVAMCQGLVGELLTKDPHVDEIFAFKKVSGWIHQQDHCRIIGPIKQGEYDTGVLLTGSFSSAWWFFRGGVQRRLGFRGHGRSLLLTDPVAWPQDVETTHHVITYKKILTPLGVPISETAPALYLSDEEIEGARRVLQERGKKEKVVGINPGAAFGSAKCWPWERFRALVEKLLDHKEVTVVIFGDPSLVEMGHRISDGLGARVINLCGRTSIRELMALISLCDVFLSNDSGPMHIASALAVPTVAIFGSTNPIKTGPYRLGHVIYKEVFCSPCYKRVCPIDFKCMLKIEVDEVYQALQGELS